LTLVAPALPLNTAAKASAPAQVVVGSLADPAGLDAALHQHLLDIPQAGG